MNDPVRTAPPPILFVTPCLGTGGSERIVVNLCLELQEDCLPVVASFRGGELVGKLREAGVAVHVLNRRDGLDFRLIFALLKLIRRYRIRVINTHHFVSLFYAFWASRISRVPIMHTEHSRWEMEKLSGGWKKCFRFLLKHTALVTAVSGAALDYLKGTFSVETGRTALVKNGIDIELFQREYERPLPRGDLGLEEDDLVIGCVGNLRPEKNQELLIRTLALLQGQNTKTKLLLIGDGPCRTSLQQLADELGVSNRVLFLGVRHDVPNLYGVMDIYCLPSRYEGLPLTLLEALAAGLPVIGTDVLGIRELIHNRENGLLVADNDPEAMREAINVLARDRGLGVRLARKGHSEVISDYSFTAFVSGYKSLFMRIIQARLRPVG